MCTVWIDKTVDTPFPYFQFPWRFELLALNYIKYVCEGTFLSHHESVVIILIKGTLEDLTKAVTNKKQVIRHYYGNCSLF